MERPLLFARCAGLEGTVEWMPLGEYPTPVEKMPGVCASEGLSDLYIKRDDLSSPHYGGNKVRKLEFLLARAKARNHRSMITFGAVGSNHVLATVIHGERVGIKTTALLWPQPNAAYVRKNLLLDYAHGADFATTGSMAASPVSFVKAYLRGYDRANRNFPYVILPGGSSPRGALGYVEGALEIKRQVDEGLAPEPEFIFATLGSSGTVAGLTVGIALAGMRSKVIAVRVVEKPVCNPYYLALHVAATRRFLMKRCPSLRLPRFRPRELTVIDDFAGPRYAEFTRESMEAVATAKECDGIKLDGTYTGKTFAGMLDFVRNNGLEKRSLLFINTYSSVDLYPTVCDIDYHVLPREMWRYFESPLQEEEMGCEVVF